MSDLPLTISSFFRIKARLNNFRVPIDSSVRLIFARRMPPHEEEESEPPLSPSGSTVHVTTEHDSNEDSDREKERKKEEERENKQQSAARASSVESKGPEATQDYDVDINDIDTDDGHADINTAPSPTPLQQQRQEEFSSDESKPEPPLYHLSTPFGKDTEEFQQVDEEEVKGDQESGDNATSSKESFLQQLESAGSEKQDKDGIKEEEDDDEEEEREDYVRQPAVQMAEHRDVVFQSALEESLRYMRMNL